MFPDNSKPPASAKLMGPVLIISAVLWLIGILVLVFGIPIVSPTVVQIALMLDALVLFIVAWRAGLMGGPRL